MNKVIPKPGLREINFSKIRVGHNKGPDIKDKAAEKVGSVLL